MKKNWLNNILNYTVTPPEGVWNDIANSLNEDDKRAAGISTKLLNYEAAAPDTAAAPMRLRKSSVNAGEGVSSHNFW
mgnify:CR=1 FL=1